MQYTYSISQDVSSATVFPSRLSLEIENSLIAKTLLGVSIDGDVLTIEYDQALDSSEETTQNSLVSNHSGLPFEDEEIPQLVTFSQTDTSGKSLIAVDKPSGDFTTLITHNFCDNSTWINGTNNSTWELVPSGAGKILDVIKAEVQFEHDLSISPTELYLDYFVHHPSSPGAPLLGQRITFDSTRGLFELGNEHYHAPSLPEISTGLTTIVFNYANKLSFHGNEVFGSLAFLRISTKNNDEITGSYSTVGFVTRERDA